MGMCILVRFGGIAGVIVLATEDRVIAYRYIHVFLSA
jgi:hypothetical protein